MTPAGGRTVAWSISDARTIFLTSTVGTLLLAWAWWESSGTGELNDQTTWLTVGVLAVSLVVLGAFLWVWSARRVLRERREELVGRMESTELLAALAPRRAFATESGLVALPASDRYHRESCLLVRGKAIEKLPSGVRSGDGRRPCEMCEP